MSLKKALWLLLVGFMIYFMIVSPAEAARVVKVTGENMGDWLGAVFDAFAGFLSNLTS